MKKNSIRKAAQKAVPLMTKCEMCGAENMKFNRHHTDYSKPTEVMILCTKCHAKVHQKPAVTSVCVVCGKTFVAKTHRIRAKICGPECLAKYGAICARKRWDPIPTVDIEGS